MIKVLKEKEKIEIVGHSNYDELGKDIVCSAVSSIVTTTINAIYKFHDNAIKYVRNDDSSTITILRNDEITLKLIDNMMELFRDLEKDYPKNICVKES